MLPPPEPPSEPPESLRPPAAAAAQVPLPPGYVLVERLGSGGFATVWLAEQGQLGRRVAVKLLGGMLDDPERERRFVAECRAIGRLSGHPAVVTVHDAGTTVDGHPYLVMEHLPGGSLHDRLRREGPLAWADVVNVGVWVADALAAAHEAGILHRDVKPANVLLDTNGAPKLGDFGIARLAEGTNTATGTLVGTIPFTPPEVLSGQRPGPTADVWALGATLHALLTGRGPYEGDSDESPAATIARVLRSDPPALPPWVPVSLGNLVRDTLLSDPMARPQTAADVVARLQRIQHERGLPVTPARSTSTAATPPPPISQETVVGLAPITGEPDAPASWTPPPPISQETVVGRAPITGEPDAPASWTPPPPSADTAAAGPADPVARSEAPEPAGATTVLGGAPGSPEGPQRAPPPPVPAPPGGPAGGERRRRSKAPLVLAGAAVLVLVVITAAVIVLTGSGDGGGGRSDRTTEPGQEGGGASDRPIRAADQVESVWGSVVTAPTGSEVGPSVVWARQVACAAILDCAAVAAADDVVLAYPDDDGNAFVERVVPAANETLWTVEDLGVPAENLALADVGSTILLVSSDSGERVYHGLDPETGDVRWGPVRFSADQRPVRAAAQPSAAVSILVVELDGEQRGVLALSNESGDELWTTPGVVLALDESSAYLSVDGQVKAFELESGTERWSTDLEVDEDGTSPITRMGVVIDDILVTVSGGEVLGLGTENGDEAWGGREPLSVDDDQLDIPLAVGAAGGLAVIVGGTGDMGVDPRSGTVAWRTGRAPLLVAGEANVWVGTGERLVAGQLGGTVRTIDLTSEGVEIHSIDAGRLAPSLSSYAFQGGVVILDDSGLRAFTADDLSVIWSDPESAGSHTVVTVDGGAAVIGPDGIRMLQEP